MRGNNREIDVYVDTAVCRPPTLRHDKAPVSRAFSTPESRYRSDVSS